MFFFEKKNQKTFVNWSTLAYAQGKIIKSFLVLFFKKENLLPAPARVSV